MIASSQTFRKYFCPPLFGELESCALCHLSVKDIKKMFDFYKYEASVKCDTHNRLNPNLVTSKYLVLMYIDRFVAT